MTQRLHLVYGNSPSESLYRVRDMALFFGIDVSFTKLENLPRGTSSSHAPSAAVVDVATFAHTPHATGPDAALQAISSLSIPTLLLVTDALCSATLHELTRGVVTSIFANEAAATLTFRPSSFAFSRELASHTYVREPTPALFIATIAGFTGTHIMDVGERPTFISWETGSQKRFVWSTRSLHNFTAVLHRESDFEHTLDQTLPLLIFLRDVFSHFCWHNPHRHAAFVIDDPLLKPSYGYIHFPQLLASARSHSYHVTLAFIPWNGWRSRREEVALFRRYADCFSICVHGCDHNRQEFGARDYPLLLDKTRIAIERMDAHAKRVDIPYSPVMVCPQEECSAEAWRSFADNRRLLAMANTSCLPRGELNQVLTSNDLLLPAHDAYFAFPIFKRYYSGNSAQFALSLFLGRPAILVEHHNYFRDGPRQIEEHVRQLRHMCPEVTWASLETIVTQTHVRRRLPSFGYEVRFFTNRFLLTVANGPEHFRLRKRINNPDQIRRILVNGAEVPYLEESGYVVFEVTAFTPGSYEIFVELKPVLPRPAYRNSLFYHSGVAARRLLSELRDDFLSHHPRTKALAQSAVRKLRLTS